MLTFVDNKHPKKPKSFYCEKCNFKTNNNSHYARHCLTKKCNQTYTENLNMTPVKNIHNCKCGKEFKTRSGLWRHQKHQTQCAGESNDDKLMELVISNQKQHDETIVKIIEMVKDISKDKSIVHNTNTNCINKLI